MSALLCCWVGCAPQATLPDDALAPIKIGVIIPFTGDLGPDGAGWRDAARVAALELNAAGGPLPGRMIELVIVDSRTDSTMTMDLTRRLIDEEGVMAIVGGVASSVSGQAAEIATPAQIPQISCCSTSSNLTEFNRALGANENFFFRVAPPDSLQAVGVAIAAEDLMCTRLGIIHLDDSYGMPFGLGIEAAFTMRGGTVVSRQPFTGGTADYAAQLAAIRDASADCIAMVAFPVSGAQIVREWATLSGAPDVTWIGTDGVRSAAFVDEAGDPLLIDQFFGTSPITDAPTVEYNAFLSSYQAIYGEAPTAFSSSQYDALAILGLAIAHAGTTDGLAIRDSMRMVANPPSDGGTLRPGRLGEGLSQIRQGRAVNYQGGAGPADFDEFGDVVAPYEIWRYDEPGRPLCTQGATAIEPDNGSFCRFRTISALELGGM